MDKIVVITADEIVQGMQRYEMCVRELSDLLKNTEWTHFRTVCAFERWTNEENDAPWQTLFIEAKHFILRHGYPPWERFNVPREAHQAT